MKIVPYEGINEWKNTSPIQEEKEKQFDYKDYLDAAEKLNQCIDYFYEHRTKNLKETIKNCEANLGDHLAHPIVISHPNILSKTNSWDNWISDMKCSFSSFVNNSIVQKSWTFGTLQKEMEELMEFAIKKLNPETKISDWVLQVEQKIRELNLYPVSEVYGYEARQNIPLSKTSNEVLKEHGVYVVRIQVKSENQEPKTFARGSGYYVFTDEKTTIKLKSSKKIHFDMKPRKRFGFCTRHVENIPNHEVGLRDLCSKNLLQEVPLVVFEKVRTGEISKTILLRPTSKMVL